MPSGKTIIKLNNANIGSYFFNETTNYEPNTNTIFELEEDITLNEDLYIVLGDNCEFDGKGYTFDMNGIEYYGIILCQSTNEQVKVRNVNVVNGNINGGGIIRSYSYNFRIEDCSTSCDIGAGAGGGIVGIDCGMDSDKPVQIERCYSTGDITSGGGITGNNFSRNNNQTNYINNCYSTGDITSGGGITGNFTSEGGKLIIEGCYSTGDITSGGGICGQLTGSKGGNVLIKSCYSNGKIRYSGGILSDYTAAGGTVNVENCYSSGDIEGSSGGLTSSIGYYTNDEPDYQNGELNVINFYASGKMQNTDNYQGFGLIGPHNYGVNTNVTLTKTNTWARNQDIIQDKYDSDKGYEAQNSIPELDDTDGILNMTNAFTSVDGNVWIQDTFGPTNERHYPMLSGFRESIWTNMNVEAYENYRKVVYGCMDRGAINYNENANTYDDANPCSYNDIAIFDLTNISYDKTTNIYTPDTKPNVEILMRNLNTSIVSKEFKLGGSITFDARTLNEGNELDMRIDLYYITGGSHTIKVDYNGGVLKNYTIDLPDNLDINNIQNQYLEIILTNSNRVQFIMKNFKINEVQPINGCDVEIAENYDSKVNTNDGSCIINVTESNLSLLGNINDIYPQLKEGVEFKLMENITLPENINLQSLNLYKNSIVNGNGYTLNMSNNSTNGFFQTSFKYSPDSYQFASSFEEAPIIKDLTLSNALLNAPGSGFICAGYSKFVKIYNCHVVNGNMNNQQDCGGIVGQWTGTNGPSSSNGGGEFLIDGCSCDADIEEFGGGIIGKNSGSYSKGSITNCYTTGNIKYRTSGGITGYNCFFNATGKVTIQNCYTTGEIKGGGIIGYENAHNSEILIQSCYTTGDIAGYQSAGISNGPSSNSSITIRSCFTTGTVKQPFSANLLSVSSGTNKALIQNCYSVTNNSNEPGSCFIRTNDNSTTPYNNKRVFVVQNCYNATDSNFIHSTHFDSDNTTIIRQNCYSPSYITNKATSIYNSTIPYTSGMDSKTYIINANYDVSTLYGGNIGTINDTTTVNIEEYITGAGSVTNQGNGYVVDYTDKNQGFPMLKVFLDEDNQITPPNLGEHLTVTLGDNAIDDFGIEGTINYVVNSNRLDDTGNKLENVYVSIKNSNGQILETDTSFTGTFNKLSGNYTLNVTAEFRGIPIETSQQIKIPNIVFTSSISLNGQLSLSYSFSDNIQRITKIQVYNKDELLHESTTDLNGNTSHKVDPGTYLVNYYVNNHKYVQIVYTTNISNEEFDSIKNSSTSKTIQELINNGTIIKLENQCKKGKLEGEYPNNSSQIYRTTDKYGNSIVELTLEKLNKHLVGAKKIEIIINYNGIITHSVLSDYFSGFSDLRNTLKINLTKCI
jgi:hypothetical protein